MITLRITYNEQWDDFCVEYLVDGIKNKKKSYYTKTKQDATNALQLMVDVLKLKGQEITSVTF